MMNIEERAEERAEMRRQGEGKATHGLFAALDRTEKLWSKKCTYFFHLIGNYAYKCINKN